MPRLEKTLKMDFEDADRADREAKDDFKRYNEVDRPMADQVGRVHAEVLQLQSRLRKRRARPTRKNVQGRRPDGRDRRDRPQAADATRSSSPSSAWKTRSSDSEEMLKVRLPRMDIQIKESLDRTALAKARAQMALSLDLESRPLRAGATQESPHQVARQARQAPGRSRADGNQVARRRRRLLRPMRQRPLGRHGRRSSTDTAAQQCLGGLDPDDDRRISGRSSSRPRSTKANGPTFPTARKLKVALPLEGGDRVARQSEIDLADPRRLRQVRNQFRRRPEIKFPTGSSPAWAAK